MSNEQFPAYTVIVSYMSGNRRIHAAKFFSDIIAAEKYRRRMVSGKSDPQVKMFSLNETGFIGAFDSGLNRLL